MQENQGIFLSLHRRLPKHIGRITMQGFTSKICRLIVLINAWSRHYFTPGKETSLIR